MQERIPTSKLITKQHDIFEYHLYQWNYTNDFTLILWWGPHTNNKKYIEKFIEENSDQNYILIEYSYDLTKWFTTHYLLEWIVNLLSYEQVKTSKIIWFSFWSYLTIQLANSYLPFVDQLVLGGFLYTYKQLDNVYQEYQDKANENWETIDLLTRDLTLMWVKKEDHKFFKTNTQDNRLQRYFEDNKYFETNRNHLNSSMKDKEYIFLSNEDDKLTPKENIYEYLKEVYWSWWTCKWEIIIKEWPHSLSTFISTICRILYK